MATSVEIELPLVNNVNGGAADCYNLISLYTSMEASSEEHNRNIEPTDNHKKAALLVKEGRRNEKFIARPVKKYSKIAYKIIHHPIFYWSVLLTALILMILAVVEEPSIYTDEIGTVEEKISLAFELVLLTFFCFSLVLRFIWLGPKLYFKSRATLITIIVIIMYLEALKILISNRHIRFTRALRIFLLLDNNIMSGVRRVLRQIFICLKYIFDVMFVLFFIIAVSSLMAYFLFVENNPTYFGNLPRSVISTLVTLTTANHPDVFMESYYKSPVAPVFFMVYMLITFYYFSNVLLAVVFAKFKAAEKKKFKKLFLHRREALLQAFDKLKDEDECISPLDFLCFMKVYDPKLSDHESMCIFKSLQYQDNNGHLSWEEFSHFYEIENMKWQLIHKSGVAVTWYEANERIPLNVKIVLSRIHNVIRHWLFDIIITIIVIANLLYLLIYITFHEKHCEENNNNETRSDQFCAPRQGITGSFVFNSIYVMEILIKLFLNGPVKYFRKWSNLVDFIIVMGSFICLCIEVSINDITWVRYLAIVRPIKLLRLLRLKKNYFFLIRIMIVLASRMLSVLLLLGIVFYFYSIIGMEIFSGHNNGVFPGCCVNASYGVGQYYSNNGSIPDNPNLYWLNNFDNIGRSYVTLYEEMVVNNWFIQMEGFVTTTNQFARIYFIFFWITSTLVVNTAIVYIVDAFESGILVLKSAKLDSNDQENASSELKKVVQIKLSEDDVHNLQTIIYKTLNYHKKKKWSFYEWLRRQRTVQPRTIKLYKGEFRGKRLMNNDDLRIFIYSNELKEWNEEYDIKRKTPHENVFSSYHESPRNFIKEVLHYIWIKTKTLFFYLLG